MPAVMLMIIIILVAKKLKRSWVEVQKIKSQWKAQKRKEGLVTARTQLTQLVVDADTDMDREMTRPSHSEGHADALEKDSENGVSISENADESSEEEESGSGSESAEDESDDASSPPPARKQKGVSREDTAEVKPTLREMQKQAYSRSSLHTHKSDPLHRRRGSQPRGRGNSADRGQDRGRGNSVGRGQDRGRGRGNDRGASRGGRGRGQPDMRLRMNAMLEKIKRDFT